MKVAVLFFALCLPAVADLAAALQAVKTGDYATALKEFLPLAKQGNAVAQFNLGYMYAHGQGVPQDYTEALRWYRKAAEQGEVNAQTFLGFIYSHGQGVLQDYAEAARWLRKAAEQRDVSSQFNLGNMYHDGKGVPQDYVQAHMWVNLAASRSSGDDQKKYATARDFLAGKMTAQQIAEAQRLARDWTPKIAKPH